MREENCYSGHGHQEKVTVIPTRACHSKILEMTIATAWLQECLLSTILSMPPNALRTDRAVLARRDLDSREMRCPDLVITCSRRHFHAILWIGTASVLCKRLLGHHVTRTSIMDASIQILACHLALKLRVQPMVVEDATSLGLLIAGKVTGCHITHRYRTDAKIDHNLRRYKHGKDREQIATPMFSEALQLQLPSTQVPVDLHQTH